MRSGKLLLSISLLLLLHGCTDQRARVAARARALAGPDAGTSGACSAACKSKAPYLCTPDKQKRCVECATDAHCQKNGASLGATCDTKLSICKCAGAADCKGKLHGSRCLTAPPRAPMCGCATDADCPSGRRCMGTLYGSAVCAAPCKANKDCTSPLSPYCDVSSGRCGQCTADTHCGGKYTPRCAKGRCVACTKDAHCLLAGKPRCDDGVCAGCAGDAHCADGKSGGLRCMRRSLEPRRCGCQVDAECKGSAHGPRCDSTTARCGCASDGECKTSGLNVCAPPFLGAPYNLCGKACAAKTDCGHGLVCDKTSGRCGQCKVAADCASTAFSLCDTARMRCVACLSDKDCGGKTPLCDPGTGRCVACKTAAQCAGSALGPVCAGGVCTCGAHKDCATTGSVGARCVSHGGLTRCGCAGDAHCAASPAGPTCYTTTRRCSCKSDADCKTAPYTKCLPAYPSAKYKVCSKPCATDADCPDAHNSRCDVKSGRCYPCTKEAHCAGNRWAKICHPYSFRCVECVGAPNCTAQTLGSKCKHSMCGCEAAADCTANVHGKLCDKYYKVCSCASDKDCPAGKKCDKTTLGTKIKLCK